MPREDVAAVVEAVEQETGHEGVTVVGLHTLAPMLIFVVGDYRVEVVLEAIAGASSAAVVSTCAVSGAWDVATGVRLDEIEV